MLISQFIVKEKLETLDEDENLKWASNQWTRYVKTTGAATTEEVSIYYCLLCMGNTLRRYKNCTIRF